jgi:exodeoxyribonuclease VII large subunit
MSHLLKNVYGYKFSTELYEAVMQGDSAESSIVNALGKCIDHASCLDVVVIVRGGGGQTDLHCFDSYEIGRAIALLPIPVISGIGHQRDVTVVDEVSNTRAKTPTAVADMIITRVKDFEDRVDSLAHEMAYGTRRLTADMHESLSALSRSLEVMVRNKLLENHHRLDVFIKGIQYSLKVIKKEKQEMKGRESSINHLNPRNVLKRGYSIAYHNGSLVKSISDVEAGDSLRTVLYEGELMSEIITKKKGGKMK